MSHCLIEHKTLQHNYAISLKGKKGYKLQIIKLRKKYVQLRNTFPI